VTTAVAHLHNHTTFSTRDGLARLDDLVTTAAADGQPALAITDHGNLGGAWRFARLARKVGVKPVIGIEAYVANGSRFERQMTRAASDGSLASGDEEAAGDQKLSRYRHLTLLAADRDGWANLATLDTLAHDPKAVWSKPRIDMELLSQHCRGLICLTGCLGGLVAGPLAAGDDAAAEENISQLHDIFGDRLFAEIMDHGIPGEREVMGKVVTLAERHGVPVVATNDAHYVRPSESEAHDAWLCAGDGKRLDDPGRWKFSGTGYWLRTAEEMHALFDDQPGAEKAVAMTLAVAEMIDDDVLPEERIRLPRFDFASEGASSSYELLFRKVRDGARRIYGERLPDGGYGPPPQHVQDRLRHELRVIKDAGFADYFLLVAESIEWARSHGIMVGYGRGSAAGSLVAYCLGITGVDPLKHNLLFERFLSPDRVGLPDIDTDYEQRGVQAVIEHLSERWGADRVARIGTYGTAFSRAAIKTVGRVLGVPEVANRLAALIPTGAGGKPYSIAELLSEKDPASAPFREALASGGEQSARIVELAKSFEGQVANETIHACGVVVADEPLVGVVPLRRDNRDGRSIYVTEWDGHDVEDLGLVKLDVLGLRNLDIVSTALAIIERTTGEKVDLGSVDEDDLSDPRVAAAWRILAEGKTAGVFQLEGAGMTKLTMQIAPSSLGELSAVIALFRPGPLSAGMHTIYSERKSGRAAVDYGIFTSSGEEAAVIAGVLDSTYGVPVYQEQLMRLGEAVAGFGPVNRDRLRKAVAKKIQEEMQAVGDLFLKWAQLPHDEQGRPKLPFALETAERLWEAIRGAGDYAFNASHSLGYAKLGFVTAYVKANWPSQFAAAVLANTDKDEQRVAIMRSAMAEGVPICRPDVNRSGVATDVDASGSVVLGLSEIDGVGRQAAEAIVEERTMGGPFTSVLDLLRRVRVVADGKARKLPVNIAQALVEAGACDAFGPRMGQVAVLHCADVDVQPPQIEWGALERSIRERRRLRLVFGESPLKALNKEIRAWVADAIPGYGSVLSVQTALSLRGQLKVVGILARVSINRKGVRRANITIEGSNASLDGVVWSDQLSELEKSGIDLEACVGRVVGAYGVVKSFSPRPLDDEPTSEEDAGRVVEEKVEMSVSRLVIAPIDIPPSIDLPPAVVPERVAV